MNADPASGRASPVNLPAKRSSSELDSATRCPNCLCSEPLSGDAPVAKRWCQTDIKLVHFSFIWTIKNFSFCDEAVGEALRSANFSTDSSNKLKWCLEVYPKGKTLNLKEYLSVCLLLISSKKEEVLTKAQFSILKANNEETNISAEYAEKLAEDESIRCADFIKLDFLQDKANALLPDDNLTLLCKGTSAVNKRTITAPTQDVTCISDHKLHRDLGLVLENQKFGDITFSVGNKELRAHKAILAVRSPVFAAMFEHEMVENRQNMVLIKDMDYEVLKEMLTYIYTGRSKNLKDVAEDLLVVADKYDLEGLKTLCQRELGAKLTTENAADLLALADMHCAKLLKKQAIAFISMWPKDVTRTPAWKNISSTHPHLTSEVLDTLASQWT